MMRYSIFLLILFIASCKGCEPDKTLQKVEIPNEIQALRVNFKRLDTDLFSSDFGQPDNVCQQLYRKYGEFFCRFIENDLTLASCESDSVCVLLKTFVGNQDIKSTHQEINRIFDVDKISSYEDQLSDAFRKWSYYFPDSLVPSIVFYQSAWNNNIHPSDSALGISLDCYLGSKNTITKKLDPEIFPQYKKDNMNESYLVADAVKGWVAYKSKKYYNPKDLLNEMIFYGKLMYVTEALVPDLPDSTMMSWKSNQQTWAEENEWSVWKEIANEKVMFQQKPFEINKWFTDGPFTGATNIPQDSPPQLGIWLGWKIVRQYMESSPKTTLQMLLEETDSQKILSSFKPNRK